MGRLMEKGEDRTPRQPGRFRKWAALVIFSHR
jgi:hypothetical protein